MDPLSFQAGNAIIGNKFECEGLELVVPPTSAHTGGMSFSAFFHSKTIVAVTGAPATVLVDGREYDSWTRIEVPAKSKVTITGPSNKSDLSGGGLRAYILIAGGFPGIPEYLGSKSTSLGFGGYQVCDVVVQCQSLC